MIRNLFIEKREQSLFTALGLFLLTLPISYGLNSISAIIIGAFFILDTPSRIIQKVKTLGRHKFFIVLVVYYLIQLIGFLYSDNTKQAINGLTTLFPFVALALTLLTEEFDKRKILKLLKYFKYYLFLILVLALWYQYFQFKSLLTFEHQTFSKVDINTFYFSAFIYVAILESLFSLINSKFKSFPDYIFIIFFSFILLLLSARISILILIFCFILFLFRLFPQIHFIKKALISMVLMLLVFTIAYQIPQIKTKVDISVRTMDFDFKTILTKNQISNSRNSIEYRIIINYCAFQILENNLLGVGIGDYRDVLNKQYEVINFRAGKTQNFNSHNQYMEEFIKQGIIGGAFFIFLVFFMLSKGYKNKGYFYYVSIYIVLVCMVESFFYRQHGVMFAAFFLPLFYNIEALDETN